MQKRAKTGGEIGTNGEFYQGGEFLPTTELASRHRAKVAPKARKEKIAQYVFDFAPEGHRAIFQGIAGIFATLRNGKMVVAASEQTFTYYNRNPADIQALCDKWNDGEFWASQAEVYGQEK